jgi:hypothetical protein
MVKEITHCSRKLRREAEEGTITRYIVVKESGGGFLVSVNDFTPTESSEHNTSGHSRDLVSMDWFSTAEQSIEMAEIAFPAWIRGFVRMMLIRLLKRTASDHACVADSSAEG